MTPAAGDPALGNWDFTMHKLCIYGTQLAGATRSSILGGAFGAFFGWALSFTQGPSPQRWPWIVGGGS